MMDDAFQTRCPAPSERDNVLCEPLSENLPTAMRHIAEKPPRDHFEAYLPAGAWQICDAPNVATMNAARAGSAQRALGSRNIRSRSQNY
jgi:hypothetical protein